MSLFIALRRPAARRAAVDIIAILLAVVLGGAAFAAVARGTVRMGPASVSVSLTPTVTPRTVVELPPVGTIEAATHRGPLRVAVRLNELDFGATKRMIEDGTLTLPPMGEVSAPASLPVAGVSDTLARIVGLGLLAACAAGALVALAFRRRWPMVAVAAVLAGIVPAGAAGLAYATWDASAFREPTLRGNLTQAPEIIDIFSTRVAKIKRLRGEASKLASDIAGYYADDRSLASGGAYSGSYRVLHVTDLHLDPVGAELARSLARSYEASLVIDTGDLPVFGAQIESSTFASLVDTSVPRVYVPGNHDSPASVAALKRLGVTVLTSGTVEVDGLHIFGVPDPISRGFGVEPDREGLATATERAVGQLEAALRSGEATPDIIAVHNPRMERPFFGMTPLILSGHTHSARFYVSQGTARLNSGTTGGIGTKAESPRTPLPYSASVLYYSAERPRRLLAIDRISVYSNRSSTITREVIDESAFACRDRDLAEGLAVRGALR